MCSRAPPHFGCAHWPQTFLFFLHKDWFPFICPKRILIHSSRLIAIITLNNLFLKFIYLSTFNYKRQQFGLRFTLWICGLLFLSPIIALLNRYGNKIYIPQKGLYPSKYLTQWMNDATNTSPTFLRIFSSCLIHPLIGTINLTIRKLWKSFCVSFFFNNLHLGFLCRLKALGKGHSPQ